MASARTITVFFSDIRGFTALAERLAPEAAVALLNQCLRAQAEIVARFGGDVDKFIGDAVFAHFGGAGHGGQRHPVRRGDPPRDGALTRRMPTPPSSWASASPPAR